MRILITLHAFLPESPNGTELYTYSLAKELARRGIDVNVLFTEPGLSMPEERVFDGLSCVVVPRRTRAGVTALDEHSEGTERALAAVLSRFKPDLIHANHLMHLSSRLPSLAKAAGVPIVMTLHDYWLSCAKVNLFDRWGGRCVSATPWKCASCSRHQYSQLTWTTLSDTPPNTSVVKLMLKELAFQIGERPRATRRIQQRDRDLRAMLGFVDRFIAPSAFLAGRLTEWGLPRDKVVVCDNGTLEIPYASRSGTPRSEPLFGFLGGPAPRKGIDVLLNAFRRLSGARLVLYGTDRGTLAESYPAFSDVLDQPNVEVGGRIDDAQKATLIPALDALIVSSICYENSPVAMHEAFLAGVPVICSNAGGMAELVIDGVNGLHFEVGNAVDLQRVLRRCIEDPALLGNLAAGVKKPLGMREHVGRQIIPLYEDVLSRSGKPDVEHVS